MKAKFLASILWLALLASAGCATTPVDPHSIGMSSWNPHWSDYGEYLQRLIDSVQVEWDRIVENSDVHPASGSRVSVTFLLNSEGKISEIVKVSGDAGDRGYNECTSALVNRAPYGKWTPDMVTNLGNEQQLTFVFCYN